jgi:hypothetical protein
MTRRVRSIAVMLLTLAFGTTVMGANLEKSVQDSEGRRRTAESGFRQIKAKSGVQSVNAPYDDAAKANNTWLDEMIGSLEQPAAAAPNLAPAAEKAAAALVAWVAVRNRSLGEFELAGAAAESVKKKVVMDLTDIASEAWKNNRTKDQSKRAAVAKSLTERLRWKTSDQLQ